MTKALSRVAFAVLSSVLMAQPLAAQAAARDTAVSVRWSGFVDGYYAWDFGEPFFDRAFVSGVPFTTQPSRHNEFNVNLAFVDATISGRRLRGRVALQAGTSVQSNYAGEPTSGAISGPDLARHIQEAWVGAQVSDDTWIEGGIFFSHMGMESWISSDNLTYTRSLAADYSPYYSAGVRAVTQLTPRLAAQLHVVNGWQNIAENNTGKGVGVRLDYTRGAGTFSYYNFFSNELGNLLRVFNGVGARYVKGALTLLGQADYGTQDAPPGFSGVSWFGATAIAHYRTSPRTAVSARLERFDDEDGVIIATGVPGSPFEATGGSIGIDFAPQPRLMWRTELRGWANGSDVFYSSGAGASRSSVFVVTSMSLRF